MKTLARVSQSLLAKAEGISEGDGEDLRRVWSEEDRLAVDEAERFDYVLGIMEDQVQLINGRS
ncbi:hypothetical protein L210DRAFT_3526668 [Boletus edulis BED1]|uniref:Uncharacterized protein n=1 Tax=Boletus edulis BED1 TaxID=1328754 RepID=A0AAD4GJE9_BOLED|nr:hypothetical protein L210DRAFT_3581530 [Boletus edulis BED1]KAF8447550.1 hypothetical protein L210DRAFT_3526668 [Boletus edulis BED1]